MDGYFMSSVYRGDGKGEWQIAADMFGQRVVWSRSHAPDDDALCGEHLWPADMRAEYERLTALPEFGELPPSMPNVVELLTDDDCAFDQPCRYGHRVESHAVYCHADHWLYSPRKCRRGKQWDGEDWPHEKCPAFAPNPALTSTKGPTTGT